MIDEFAKKFFCDVQKLQDKIFNVGQNHKQDWIHRSYPYFIQFFLDKKTLKKQDVMIGRFFSYGWMPTILNELGDISKENRLVEYLNKAKDQKEERLTPREIEYVASCIKNSVVGASKLLHFINPNVYAIWDSRVYEYLYSNGFCFTKNIPKNTKKQPYRRCELYVKYLDLIEQLSSRPGFNEAKICFQEKINYNVTNNRFAEYVMYLGGEGKK